MFLRSEESFYIMFSNRFILLETACKSSIRSTQAFFLSLSFSITLYENLF